MPSDSAWKLLAMAASRGPGERLTAVFSLQLSASQLASSAAFPIIYAMGPIVSGVLLPHGVSAFASCARRSSLSRTTRHQGFTLAGLNNAAICI